MSNSAQEGIMGTATGRKRNRDLYDSLLSIVTKNANNKPQLLPRRQPTESQLMAQYTAGKDAPHQQAPRSPAAFQYTPHKKVLPAPSIFSPATSRAYASPNNGSIASAPSPVAQSSALLIQQQGRLGRSPVQSFTPTPMRSRCLASTAFAAQQMQAASLLFSSFIVVVPPQRCLLAYSWHLAS